MALSYSYGEWEWRNNESVRQANRMTDRLPSFLDRPACTAYHLSFSPFSSTYLTICDVPAAVKEILMEIGNSIPSNERRRVIHEILFYWMYILVFVGTEDNWEVMQFSCLAEPCPSMLLTPFKINFRVLTARPLLTSTSLNVTYESTRERTK